MGATLGHLTDYRARVEIRLDPEQLALLREVLGLFLILAGVVAVVWALWQVDYRAGTIGLGVASIAVGAYLGRSR